ncbi:MAG: sugar ABC transporter permease [Ilumatobacteraceae bacterium]
MTIVGDAVDFGESIRARTAEPDHDLGVSIRVLAVWHVVGALACAAGVMLARRGGEAELPWMPKYALLGFFSAALVANVASAYGVSARTRWARPTSLAVNYLVAVVGATTTLHLFDAYRSIGSLGDGLYKAFLPFLVVCVGMIWVLVAGQLLANRPTASGPLLLRKAGWSLTAVAFVWFVVAANPSGLIDTVGRSITRPLTLGALALTVGASLATRLMWSRAAARHFGTSRSTQEALTGLAFLSPNLFGFLVFFAFPLLFSLVVSFFDWETTNTSREFIGFGNYVRALSLDVSGASRANAGTEVLKPGYQVLMNLDWLGQHWVLGARDVEFWLSMRNIMVFLVLAVPLAVLPGLVLSSVLASKLPGMKVFRAIYFVPSVAGVIGVSIIWGQMFDATIGWINYLLDLVGLSSPGQGHGWLTQRSTALVSMVVVFAWMNFGFNTILYLAGHQAIPKELYEAAEIDGANVWQIFRRITVPQLRNTTFYVLITTSIMALQLFDIVWILSRPAPGGPNNATLTPVLTLYQEAFANNSQGYASALAWVLFIVIFGFTSVQFRQQRDQATSGGLS